MEYRLERNGKKHAPRHSTSDDLFARLRKLWDTSKSPLKNTPEPVAETVLDVETLTQDDSQTLVEDAQPLENMPEIQGADTVGSKPDYVVWFDLELGTAWRSITGSPPEQAVTLQVPENARGWSSMVGVWSDGWRHELADISVDEYQRRRTVSSSPTPSVPVPVPVPVPVEKTPAIKKHQQSCGRKPTNVLARRSRWSVKSKASTQHWWRSWCRKMAVRESDKSAKL